MGGAAVQASSQSFIASPENSGNVPNNPSNPVNSNETVKKNLRTKSKPLYRELSDYPNDPVTIDITMKKQAEIGLKPNISNSSVNISSSDSLSRIKTPNRNVREFDAVNSKKNVLTAPTYENRPKTPNTNQFVRPMINASIPPRIVTRIVPSVPPPPTQSPHARKLASVPPPVSIVPPIVTYSDIKTPGRRPNPSPKSSSPIHAVLRTTPPKSVNREGDEDKIKSPNPPSPVIRQKQPDPNHTVKDTTNVCRKRASLPSSPPHPKPIAGSWLSKRVIVNNYIILDLLGTGSFAEVRLCKDRKSNMLFAIKIINRSSVDSKKLIDLSFEDNKDNALSDIHREIAVMKKLNHPNIVRLFEVMDDPNVNKLYLVLEYMKNGDLLHTLHKDGDGSLKCLSDDIVWNVFKQVVSGVAYLHKQDIVHGDIKPQNLLVSEDGTIKLADFGISKMLNVSSQKLTETAGTPAFMAPEVCSGSDYSGQLADVWALGATIYMVRFGHPPFIASTVLQLYHKIINDGLSFDFSISFGLFELLSSMLVKNPLDRSTIDSLLRHPWTMFGPAIDSQLSKNETLRHSQTFSPAHEVVYDIVSVTSNDIYQSINQVTVSKKKPSNSVMSISEEEEDDDDNEENEDDRCLDQDETDKRMKNFKKMMKKSQKMNDDDDDFDEVDDEDEDVTDAFLTLPGVTATSPLKHSDDDDDDDYNDARAVSGAEVNDILDTLGRQSRRPVVSPQRSASRPIRLDWSDVTVSGRLRNVRTSIGMACTSTRGNRNSQEDRLFVVSDASNARQHLTIEMNAEADSSFVSSSLSDVSIAGVFDGHGGSECAEVLSEQLIQNLLFHKLVTGNVRQAMIDTFQQMDRKICNDFRLDLPNVGSTALIAVYSGDQNTLTIANVGDSICVLSRGGRAVRVNKPHRVISNDSERDRILNAGGCIANNRLNGSLAVTRSFGDVFHKDNIPANQLIALPEFDVQIVTPQTEFALLATDGLWDVISDQEAVDFLRSQLCANSDLHKAIQKLSQHAISLGSVDNITIITIGFHIKFPSNEVSVGTK